MSSSDPVTLSVPAATEPSRPDQIGRPDVLVFDVNETLSDLSPMASRFADVGAPGHLANTWFAGLLRDGIALTVVDASDSFARIAAENLRVSLHGLSLDPGIDEAIEHIMNGFADLAVHPDVGEGIGELHRIGIRLVTLSNGATSVAEGLFASADLRRHFERLLSVEDAGIWKPAAEAYRHALVQCHVEAADAMLVSVHPWDIDGASRAGLRVAWINRSGGPYPNYFRPPDVQATSLVDLAHKLT